MQVSAESKPGSTENSSLLPDVSFSQTGSQTGSRTGSQTDSQTGQAAAPEHTSLSIQSVAGNCVHSRKAGGQNTQKTAV
jgi:hypothetical protein